MQRLIALAVLASSVLLAACASRAPVSTPAVELPQLQLAPAALGREVALQQKLAFVRGEQRRELDALLEVDAGEVRLLVMAMGRSGVRLSWDGKSLEQQRAPWLPVQVRGERVLDDLQFALWPLDAIRAALPAGWSVAEADGERRLLDVQGRAWLVARGVGEFGYVELRNLAEGYELQVRSSPAQGDAP